MKRPSKGSGWRKKRLRKVEHVLLLKSYLSPFYDEAGRSKMFEHEGIKRCGSLFCTDILGMQGAFMRSFESAEGDGEGMALKI